MNRNKAVRHTIFIEEERRSVMWDKRVQGWAAGSGDTFLGVFKDFWEAWHVACNS